MAILTKIQKWGNSSAIRLPLELLKDTPFSTGAVVVLTRDKNTLVLTPTKKQYRSLDERIKALNSKNLQNDDWGNLRSVGKEIL